MLLDKNSPIPLYHQLAEGLKREIEDGEWATNEILPSETDLCEQYKISRGTVRQAISELIKSGLVSRNQGKGTFVAESRLVWPVSSFYCFDNETENDRSKFNRKLIEKKIIIPDESIRKNMDLEKKVKVYKIVSVVFSGQEAVALEVSYLIEKLFPNLLKKQNLNKIAPYEIFMKEYKIKITRVRESFKPIVISKSDSEKLNIPSNSLVLLVNRKAWTNNVIFEFRMSTVRSDISQYTVELL